MYPVPRQRAAPQFDCRERAASVRESDCCSNDTSPAESPRDQSTLSPPLREGLASVVRYSTEELVCWLAMAMHIYLVLPDPTHQYTRYKNAGLDLDSVSHVHLECLAVLEVVAIQYHIYIRSGEGPILRDRYTETTGVEVASCPLLSDILWVAAEAFFLFLWVVVLEELQLEVVLLFLRLLSPPFSRTFVLGLQVAQILLARLAIFRQPSPSHQRVHQDMHFLPRCSFPIVLRLDPVPRFVYKHEHQT